MSFCRSTCFSSVFSGSLIPAAPAIRPIIVRGIMLSSIFSRSSVVSGTTFHVIVNIFYLTFFPGTPLYDQAVKDGYTEPFGKKTSRLRFFTRQGVKVRYQKNYEMFLILFIKKFRLHCIDHQFRYRRWIPLAVFRLLGIKPLRAIASLFPESFFMFLFKKLD